MFKDKRIRVSITDGDPFGCIACPECHAIWPNEFVPEYCTRCGTRVAATRGKGREDLVRLEELTKSKIIVCKRCGERYPDVPGLVSCFRCFAPLEREAPKSRLFDFFRRVLGLRS
jgi:DNA-directed RNA polymerase subunit RPC12/RpoP